MDGANSNTDPLYTALVRSLAAEVINLLKPELAKMATPVIQPALLDVKQAAVYLGRTEQSVQHLIYDKELPVVRVGRRVHLHRHDLDRWIEKHKY
jgi:excisionase family DNA binding protein